MSADITPTPMQGPSRPEPVHAGEPSSHTLGLADDAAPTPQRRQAVPQALDLVELDLALDLSDIADRGFCDAVRDAAKTVGGEFLFDLPASGLAENAQRIAVVCLSRDNGGRFGLVLLSADGDRVEAVEADEATGGLVQFAKAFVAVLEKL